MRCIGSERKKIKEPHMRKSERNGEKSRADKVIEYATDGKKVKIRVV